MVILITGILSGVELHIPPGFRPQMYVSQITLHLVLIKTKKITILINYLFYFNNNHQTATKILVAV